MNTTSETGPISATVDTSSRRESQLARISRLLCCTFFTYVGITHFTNPDLFLLIMPPYLPWHLELVYLSGAFEIAGGLALMISKLRRTAGWGLLLLLAAVYPANVHMLINDIYLPDMPQERWLLWLRMPMQFVLAYWVVKCSGLWPVRTTSSG